MDKLKAVLVYKFWMLLGVSLLVPVIGWWMATSDISAQVEERQKKLDGAFESLKASGDSPNETWTKQIQRQMGGQESAVQQAHQFLFEGQKSLLKWPAELSWPSETIPTESQITQKDIDNYRNLYDDLIVSVHQIPKPLDGTTETGEELYLVDFPFDRLPQEDFSNFPPTRQQIIETREDMWLLSALLTAIANINQREGAQTQMEAPIRQILKIELRGGRSRGPSGLDFSGTDGGAAGMMGAGAMMMGGSAMPGAEAGGMTAGRPGAGGGHSDAGAMMGMGKYGSAMGMDPADMGGGRIMGAGVGGAQTNVEFDPAEVFGPDGGSDAAGGGMGMEAAGMDSAMDAMGAMGSAMPGAPAGAMPAGAMPAGAMPAGMAGGPADAGGPMGIGGAGDSYGNTKRRYIEDNSKYKTRGFYLLVTMDHVKLPNLLVELSNSPWPVRVMRVQQADLHMQDLATAAGYGSPLASPGFLGSAAGFGPASAQSAFPGSTAGFGPASASPGYPGPGAGFGAASVQSRFPASAAAFPSEAAFSSPAGLTARAAGTMDGAGAAPMGSGSALDDPLLAQIALCGFFTIYKPPPTPEAVDKTKPSSKEPTDDVGKPEPSPAGTPDNTPSDPKPTDVKPTGKTEEKAELLPE